MTNWQIAVTGVTFEFVKHSDKDTIVYKADWGENARKKWDEVQALAANGSQPFAAVPMNCGLAYCARHQQYGVSWTNGVEIFLKRPIKEDKPITE